MVTLSSTKEARIYNGKKITSLTSGVGKIGQPLVKKLYLFFGRQFKLDELNIKPDLKKLLQLYITK